VFDPIFDKIWGLVREQMNTIQRDFQEKLKVIFLVGGLGSNLYLGKFLQGRVGQMVDVKQPEAGYVHFPLWRQSLTLEYRYSAIVKGAVLYKLGLDFVKERVLRMHYGIWMNPLFREGHHPQSKKYTALDGTVRCRGVMDWYANKAFTSLMISLIDRDKRCQMERWSTTTFTTVIRLKHLILLVL
jgi:hypothetical protein